MQEENKRSVVIASSFLTGIVTMAACFCTGHAGWSWGFFFGAALSLFSLCTLTWLCPILLHPKAPAYAPMLMVLILLIKMPLFVGGLYLMTHVPGVSAPWGVAGILLAPCVIAAKTVADLVWNALPYRLTAPVETAMKRVGRLWPRKRRATETAQTELAGEGG